MLFERIHEIGYFQFKYFLEMIPADFRTIWLDALASDFFKLKLCGAGGGGFLLGMTFDFEKTIAKESQGTKSNDSQEYILRRACRGR